MLTLSELAGGERSAIGSIPEAAESADRIRRLAERLIGDGRSGDDPAFAWMIPGRIEVLGKHTDYAGGRSLTCAIERGFTLVAAARSDREVAISDLGRDARAVFDLDPDLETDEADWTRYARTVARRIARDFGAAALVGADIALESDLPPAAGMSSSSALVVALFSALAAVNELAARADYRSAIGSPEQLAGYLGAVENGLPFAGFESDLGVGTFGGSEDHTAILCSSAGRIGQYSYAPVRAERSIALPEGYLFVVASSGIRAKKTGSARAAYNRLALGASTAADAWRRASGADHRDLASIFEAGVDLDRSSEAIASVESEGFTADELRARVEHFHAESLVLVPQAGDALERGDMAVFGLLTDRSQHLAERLLGNQVPETVALAEGARELGAVAASAFGAGFGGAVWALVEQGDADEFAESWLGHYVDRFPERADEAVAIITTAAGPARGVEA